MSEIQGMSLVFHACFVRVLWLIEQGGDEAWVVCVALMVCVDVGGSHELAIQDDGIGMGWDLTLGESVFR